MDTELGPLPGWTPCYGPDGPFYECELNDATYRLYADENADPPGWYYTANDGLGPVLVREGCHSLYQALDMGRLIFAADMVMADPYAVARQLGIDLDAPAPRSDTPFGL